MVLRDVALREHQVVALHAADVDLVLVEGFATLGAPLLADDDREHSGASDGEGARQGATRHVVTRTAVPGNCRRSARSVSTAWTKRVENPSQSPRFAAAPERTSVATRDRSSPARGNDVLGMEPVAPQLAVDGLRQDGQGTRIACARGLAEGKSHCAFVLRLAQRGEGVAAARAGIYKRRATGVQRSGRPKPWGNRHTDLTSCEPACAVDAKRSRRPIRGRGRERRSTPQRDKDAAPGAASP